MQTYFTLIGFGPQGWGGQLAWATLMTISVSVAAFATGVVFGIFGAWAKLAGGAVLRSAVDAYTTVLRGIPDLLVIYLFYFGGSSLLTSLGRMMGNDGFLGLNGFLVGMLAVGTVSGAYQTEVMRAAYLAIPRGEIEAARAVGMGRWLMLRRIIVPRGLRIALPGLGNIWQQVLKESALISVTGMVELLRQIHIAAGSTRLPFDFYATGAALFLILTTITSLLFRGAERRTQRHEQAI